MSVAPHPILPARKSARSWLLGAGALFIGAMLVAFARTFYLKPFFPETDAVTVLVAVHGIVMTGWPLLFVVQSGLIIARKTQWHRHLGKAGLGWAVGVVVMGTLMTLHATARDVRSHDGHAAITIQILALELTQMMLFAWFVGFGYLFRNRPNIHRRLMTFSLACMLPSLIARLPLGARSTFSILLWTDAIVLAIIALDCVKNRRIHPTAAAGALAYFVGLHAAFWVGIADWWVRLTTALLS